MVRNIIYKTQVITSLVGIHTSKGNQSDGQATERITLIINMESYKFDCLSNFWMQKYEPFRRKIHLSTNYFSIGLLIPVLKF